MARAFSDEADAGSPKENATKQRRRAPTRCNRVGSRSSPIADGELAGLFTAIGGLGAVGLAVSGGPDSTALMHLYARWSDTARAPRALVLTINHGLRPESQTEVAAVADAARRLGLSCETLRWEGAKPATGIQEAARDARRRLLAEAASKHRLDAILTAHTQDDQAETLLMRLARGSGLDGLAGISERNEFDGVAFLRPLLGIAKARLVATLNASSIAYVSDPSNSNPRFERSRLRSAALMLDALGLTAESLALSARRLGRARRALDELTDQFARAAVEVSALGVATLDLDRLDGMPDEIAVRLVQRLVAATGGDAEPASLAKIEEMAQWLTQAESAGRTLARCEIKIVRTNRGRSAIFLREIGRELPAGASLMPGGSLDWDGRFRIRLAERSTSAHVRPGATLSLGADPALRALARTPGFDAAPLVLRDTTLLGTPLDFNQGAIFGVSFAFLGHSAIFGVQRRAGATQK